MKLDLIIPVYRNVKLVEACITSLVKHIDEVAAYEPRIIVINDSPDDLDVNAYLAKVKAEGLIQELVRNPKNLGFVKSVNKGLTLSKKRQAAAILVNSDTLTYQNTLAEMMAVLETDPQIGFVCPRSNNASISTFPQAPHNMSGIAITPEVCYKAWKSVHHHLERYTWAPTAVGFYMLIAPDVVLNFGTLDEEFGLGYEEENDMVMRAGKVGYRAVMANHAFAYHAGSASFMLHDMDLKGQQQGNLQKMSARHPEFLPLVWAFEGSAEYRAELKIRQLVPTVDGKLKIALNLLTFGKHHNGTSEHMMHFVRWCDKAAPDNFEIYAICEPSVAKFHGIDELKRIKVRKEFEPHYAISIFPGQPFDLHIVNVMEHLAPINIYGMLDVIALDCSHLRASNDLQTLWSYIAKHANGLFFNSEFSELTFRNRFEREFNTSIYTKLLPTQVSAYVPRFGDVEKGREHVLVMGNHFPHKASEPVGAVIAKEMPSLSVVTLGGSTSTSRNARIMQSGVIPEDEMNDLFARASVVVLPSYYEGFGLSLLNALALGKPIVARDIPPTREILSTYKDVKGVFLFRDNREIPTLIKEAISAETSSVVEKDSIDWDQWSKGLFDFCANLVNQTDIHRRIVERTLDGDILRRFAQMRQQDSQPNPMANTFIAPTEVHIDHLLSLEHEPFVRGFYEQLLGRRVDPAGLEHHLALLNGGTSKAEILHSILESEEFLENRTSVSVVGRQLLRKQRRSWFSKLTKAD
ncbi:glycosyltransferase [Sphingobium scionense]|uniref:GT2 family glycosyltransferase/glycosyltransferase involved in cell wall biosynthesis n=1 Tax=Sphingobium scionense TaxID=1404341 RepID=A0A7W6PWR4_9SPHN|nr:glycosyltransferase [Sphingobium scionense]MBB4149429.1 GT2 family glycosyltransferase/glycosyltransferase involved in cell wall biosynthesis [Sphingobium scionense]